LSGGCLGEQRVPIVCLREGGGAFRGTFLKGQLVPPKQKKKKPSYFPRMEVEGYATGSKAERKSMASRKKSREESENWGGKI